MTAKIIDGNAIAKHVRAQWKARVQALQAAGIKPGLAVIIVGENPASRIYVRNKIRACAEVGLHSEVHEFGAQAPQDSILERIEVLNASDTVHGILVQLPLPPHVEARRLLGAIAIEKDVDGFHLYNVGGLVVGENNVFPPVRHTACNACSSTRKFRSKARTLSWSARATSSASRSRSC